MKHAPPSRTVYFVSLGCPKNRVDTDGMASLLHAEGYRITPRAEEADLIVVNTCAFIEPATEESLDTIMELLRCRRQGRCKRLVVAGCLYSRYGEDLVRNLPEVDLFIGTDEFEQIGGKLREIDPDAPCPPSPDRCREVSRLRSTPFFTAYVKIADGCNNRCTFCVIPGIRGPYRSTPPGRLLEEARRLAEDGVREINLVAQDTSAYGLDLDPPFPLHRLLESLACVPGLRWVRMLYLHPHRIISPLLDVVAAHEELLPYFDLPIQHVSPRILKRMGRWNPQARASDLVRRIRRRIPNAVLRMTVMVGFPGESDSDFEELLDFVRQTRPDHLGAFRFFPEEGSAASRLPGRIPEALQEERLARVMELQASISLAKNRERIASRIAVLAEASGNGPKIPGRAWWQAPEVDGRVWIEGAVEAGNYYEVEITEASTYDLFGRVCGAIPGETL